jgi:hypothetical protein
LVLFAGDTNLFITEKGGSALQPKLKNCMKDLETWFPKNIVIMNAEKSIALSFLATQNSLPVRQQISLKYIEIACQSELRFLDIHVTENLKLNTQV